MPNDPMFGFKIREQLHPGEDAYFKSNPHVGGMAAETGDIILNPYAPPEVNRDAVARNEAFRLHLQSRGTVPDFPVTDEQRKTFAGTPYGSDDAALRSTLAARVYSNDPSAQATPEQRAWVDRFTRPRSRQPLSIGRQQYFMPREEDWAGSWPVGYFGDKTPSGAPSPNTLYMEMAKQTDDAQKIDGRLGVMLRTNPAAVQRFIAEQPASTNIEDRRGEIDPLPETAVAEAPGDTDPNSPLARALGYGSIDRRPVPMPRPRPRIGRQTY